MEFTDAVNQTIITALQALINNPNATNTDKHIAERTLNELGTDPEAFCLTKVEWSRNLRGEFEWYFNWKGGGFNTIWADSKASAKIRIKEMETTSLQADFDSIRRLTIDGSRNATRVANMMTM